MGNLKKDIITDSGRNNRIVMICHAMVAVIYIFTFLLELVRGNRSVGYVAIVIALTLWPVVGEAIAFIKNHESKAIMHFAAIGFALVYTVVIFTATNANLYVYAIPMVLVSAVYNDIGYSLKINIGTVIVNVIAVVVGSKTGRFGFIDLDSGTIQIAAISLTAIFSFLTSRVSNENNRRKIDNMLEAQNRTDEVLKELSEISEKMQIGISDIHDKVGELGESSEKTKEAMDEVTSGANETAEAVQKQLLQTEEIQKKVAKVSNAADAIQESMRQTLEVLESGKKDVEILVKEVENSVEKGADVAEKLGTLDKYIEEMNSIVELIGGITSQTSLLALNASIEAARAGEAGKGFSVVAGEISHMATQTKDATAHITELIENVSGAISQVVGVVRGMIDAINDEKQSTQNTASSFETIKDNTVTIRDNVEQLTGNVEELELSNREIADSVQTISAISEEVSAHANETLSAEEENMRNLNTIAARTQELMKLTRNA